jgi:hypothetical protein
MWRTVYWAKLPRIDRQIRVAVDWTLDLLFPADIVQLGMGRPHPVEGERESGGAGEHSIVPALPLSESPAPVR